MKKIRFIFLSMLLSISLYIPCFNCYAQGDTWTDSQKTQFFAEGFYKIVTDICGLILPTGLGGQNLQADYQNYVLNNNWIQSNMSYDEWIASQISGAYINGSSGNADITFSADLQNSLKDWSKYYIDNNLGFVYGYSTNASSYLSFFTNQEEYHSFLDFISSNSDKLVIINGNPNSLILVDVPYSFVKYNYDTTLSIYNTRLYNGWSIFRQNEVQWWSMDHTIRDYVQNTVTSGGQINTNFILSYSPSQQSPSVNQSWVVNQNITQYIIYNSLDSLKGSSEGVQDYYVTDSYNNTQVSETYNTTTNNVNNSITYGDVQNYVNNYYVENNSYPTSNIVYNYINNYTPPDNGGGSGGDNGGGNSNIWDFLGTIGDVLGGLIEGVGNVLSGILAALTDVIDMFIGENGLPNVISQLISYFLPFLPEWIPTLIGFSVVLALILGIIKLIRG